MTEDQAIQQHVTATGQFAQAALARLKTQDPDTWAATMQMMAAGAMLSVNTTAALSGLLHIAMSLSLPDGSTHTLLQVEIETDQSPTLN